MLQAPIRLSLYLTRVLNKVYWGVNKKFQNFRNKPRAAYLLLELWDLKQALLPLQWTAFEPANKNEAGEGVWGSVSERI